MRPDMAIPRRDEVWRAVLLPLVVGVLTTVGTHFAGLRQPEARPLDVLGTALLLAGPAVLVARRWQPLVVFGLATGALLGYWSAGYPFGPVFLAALAALATAVTSGYRWGAYAITGGAFAASVLIYLVQHPGDRLPVSGSAAWLAWLVTFVAGCELWRSQRDGRARAREAHEQAHQRRGVEERLRIARELHDALGHHVSLINVQAGVALYLIDDDPEQARAALAAIKQASRELLGEMRSTLGVLRGVDEDPPRHPVAGLARIEDLIADNLAAGLPVELEVRGERRELPPSVDLAAYRIVQESLTNTRRHAHATSATVTIRYADDELTVQVDDDGTGLAGEPTPDVGGGSGLAGMRERATALGGALSAGPRRGGGFRVRAGFPVGSDRSATAQP